MKKSELVLLCTLFGFTGVRADVSETVFYPSSDFSSAVSHFHHQGDAAENYGFLLDEGFDTKRIVYAQPSNYTTETLQDGKIKLVFGKTDRYSYMQELSQEDYVVGIQGDTVHLLISGGECMGSQECVTEQNIVTAVIPDGYTVIRYRGLDQDLKELKAQEWKREENTYTLFAPNVKGACIYMEVEKKASVTGKTTEIQPDRVSRKLFENKELFVVGDVKLTLDGSRKLRSLIERIGSGEILSIGVFQDKIPPKRLARKYPTAEAFSRARAGAVYNELINHGLSREQLRIEIIAKESERTRVEALIARARQE